ncbi:Bax inhibitor-1 family protein [Hymenobacter latericus]|uniref:Bax inhibitor-1 family protein n=1 Tax=Hymenobacter sp. YIM 151858-1 TaxID=2987688 RepID=UPI0022269086|nr:Bax inhibitor-1 family protein [Hymenobacter sp. YIM 151858-1]UYZ61010.1 Bax inhibitor-1 family protein [Hymenobacter sp. YIM 151858-1]
MQEIVPQEGQELQPASAALTAEQVADLQAYFMTQVLGWLTGALALSGGTAMVVAASPELQAVLFGTAWVFVGVVAVLIVTGLLVAPRFAAQNTLALVAAFVVCVLAGGLALGVVFREYSAHSLGATFFIASAVVGSMLLYGYFARAKMSSWAGMLLVLLITLALAAIGNMLWPHSLAAELSSAAGVLLFVPLTAYDANKLKGKAFLGLGDENIDRKVAVRSAFGLYFNLLCLFLSLLSLTGVPL